MTHLILLNFNIWNNNATVVDLPFVPVIPIILASGFVSKNKSISLIILTLFSIASRMAKCLFFEFSGKNCVIDFNSKKIIIK